MAPAPGRRTTLHILLAAVLLSLVTLVESPAATSVPQPSSAMTALPATKAFGTAVGCCLQYQPDAERAAYLDDLVALGVTWIRMDIRWTHIQQGGRNSYDWFVHDRLVREARGRGISVVGLIAYTPTWARPRKAPTDDSGDKFAPADLNDYANFAGEVARHYRPMGVHAWEIWNEPNNAEFWKDSVRSPKPNPSRYTSMMKSAYSRIRQADPTATVVSGGLSPAVDDGTNVSPYTFVRSMYAGGAKGHFDALGHHPYTYPAMPSAPYDWSAWQQMHATSRNLRQLMTANGDEAKAIWATEYGAPTCAPPCGGVTESDQARMADEAAKLWKSYSWSGALFWYSHRDVDTSDAAERGDHFGLVRTDWSRKPAYDAFKAAIAPVL